MTTYVVATNASHVSRLLGDYLAARLGEGDAVHAVNSQVGHDETDADDIRQGEEALDALAERLEGEATVETHQFVRGNEPAADVLTAAADVDADEIVIGVRKRTPTQKLVFGSVAQSILVNADRPVVCVPRAGT